jgi:hypothetical protein
VAVVIGKIYVYYIYIYMYIYVYIYMYIYISNMAKMKNHGSYTIEF